MECALQKKAIASSREEMLETKRAIAKAMRHNSSKRLRELAEFEMYLRCEARRIYSDTSARRADVDTDEDWLELQLNSLPIEMLSRELSRSG